ncbi:MAG: DNA-deoxyinosine glycosylase [Treponema sp.]
MYDSISMIEHPFQPVYDFRSRILILGSFPSETSRTQQFYYGHPRNRFWKVLAAVCGCAEPKSIDEKKAFLLSYRIALYDAIQSCTITKSEDASIRNAVPAELSSIFTAADIQAVFANGAKAYQMCTKQLAVPVIQLPSTSAANARWSFEALQMEWRKILPYITPVR